MSVNQAQEDYWTSPAGLKWIEHEHALDTAMSGMLDTLLDAAEIAPSDQVLDIGWALLRNCSLRRDFPFPRRLQATRTISAEPSALKRFIRAMRIWISAVWRSGSLAAIRSPKALRHRIFASIRLRA